MRSPPDTAGQAGERFGSGTRKRVMDKVAQNIQETFLNSARKDKIFLTIYLISGVKLAGRIKSFDKYSVVLEANNQEQLIFKHAISTIVISKPLNTTGHAGGVSQTPGNPLPPPEISENNH
jgi:host factor-I protein